MRYFIAALLSVTACSGLEYPPPDAQACVRLEVDESELERPCPGVPPEWIYDVTGPAFCQYEDRAETCAERCSVTWVDAAGVPHRMVAMGNCAGLGCDTIVRTCGD